MWSVPFKRLKSVLIGSLMNRMNEIRKSIEDTKNIVKQNEES